MHMDKSQATLGVDINYFQILNQECLELPAHLVLLILLARPIPLKSPDLHFSQPLLCLP